MGHSILIVDDASFMRQLIREIVEPEGFCVVGEAGDGKTACAVYRELRPDLVTMDVVMQHGSGIDAAREILALDAQAKIVMVSALGQESLILDAMQAGAAEYIVKPFKAEEVIAALRRVTDKGT